MSVIYTTHIEAGILPPRRPVPGEENPSEDREPSQKKSQPGKTSPKRNPRQVQTFAVKKSKDLIPQKEFFESIGKNLHKCKYVKRG